METPTPIRPGVQLVRVETPFASQIEGETVIMSLETNNYYGFGRVGSRIWALLAEPNDLEGICGSLEQEFKVDSATCLEDTRRFLEQLLRERLIKTLE